MPDRTVLVTGGAGFIGSHTCKALAQAGYTPVCYDNLFRGHASAVKWGPLEIGDILDPLRIAEVLSRYRPMVVIHFAALAYVGESVEGPASYYRTNVIGSHTLLEVMRAHTIGSIVFSSSCATYGVPKSLPISESQPQQPINPYGMTKLIGEKLLIDYAHAYGLRSIGLRYFNAAGSDPDGEIGENHDPETHLIPLVLQAAMGTRPDVTIFGTDHGTPDGTCIRDYVHVSDLAQAHVLALKLLEQGHRQEFFNIGNGGGISVAEIVAASRQVTGRPIEVRNGPRRAGDPAVLVADATKARTMLAWSPKHAEITTMIDHTWNWMLRQNQR